LVFIDIKTGKPCQAPELLLNKFKKEKK